nr:methylated-DNA--[protein]-cysteine S-methyltransferase [Tissierella sp.]
MKNLYYYDTMLGVVGIMDNGKEIIEVFYGDKKIEDANIYESTLIKEACRQINLFLEGKIKAFDLPIYFKGTEFQMKVWNALRDIPYGETKSYKDIAEKVGSPKAYRAVGMTNNKNPISIIIPCHRVIGANGKLVGYGGGIDIKEKLLELERVKAED